jgi:hypothetical protein
LLRNIVAVVLLCSFLPAQSPRPERDVGGNVITSARDPRVRIRLPKSVQYVGANRWVLYDIADCELHIFVDADSNMNVQRLYWVQFEGYLATRPELKHTYDSPRHTSLGGMDFYVDTWVRRKDAEMRPGSDLEHVGTLLRTRGYHMPDGMMYVRLVHLLDERKRQELMIIYGEDVAPTGFTASDLQEGGKAYDRWSSIADGVVHRAEKSLVIDQKLP